MHRILAALAALLLATGVPARADSFSPAQRAEIVEIVRQALKSDPSILREAVTALQEADERAQDADTRGAVNAIGPALAHNAADPVDGNPQGDVTVVEFFDARCPYCRRMLPAMADLLKRDPNLRVVYKDIPILGPGSLLASRALLAAQKQDGYLKLRQIVMTGPAEITQDSLRAAAGKAGLDWQRLSMDMSDPAIQTRIDANLDMARKLRIQGTPAYVVGDQLAPGALSVSDLQEMVVAARKAK